MIIGRMLQSLINKSLEMTIELALYHVEHTTVWFCIIFLTMVVKGKFFPLHLLDCMGL